MKHRRSETPQETIVRLRGSMTEREAVTRAALESTNRTIRALEAQTGDLVLHRCAHYLRRAGAILDLVARDERAYRTPAS